MMVKIELLGSASDVRVILCQHVSLCFEARVWRRMLNIMRVIISGDRPDRPVEPDKPVMVAESELRYYVDD